MEKKLIDIDHLIGRKALVSAGTVVTKGPLDSEGEDALTIFAHEITVENVLIDTSEDGLVNVAVWKDANDGTINRVKTDKLFVGSFSNAKCIAEIGCHDEFMGYLLQGNAVEQD